MQTQLFDKATEKNYDYHSFMRSGIGLLMTIDVQKTCSWEGRYENNPLKNCNSMAVLTGNVLKKIFNNKHMYNNLFNFSELCEQKYPTPPNVLKVYLTKYFSNLKWSKTGKATKSKSQNDDSAVK